MSLNFSQKMFMKASNKSVKIKWKKVKILLINFCKKN